MKFLIIQLGHFGDCLYVTTIAKQIKNDFPFSHITWAIASRYRSILDGNPDVDRVWEISTSKVYPCDPDWKPFLLDVHKRKGDGEFDEVIFPQVLPFNLKNCTGTIRGTLLNSYPKPITVPVTPVLRLSQKEIENVKNFAFRNRLADFQQVVLFECNPTSKQSPVNISMAIRIAEYITKQNKEVLFIISSIQSLSTSNDRIVDASEISFRENAELIRYCDLLIGCSSGITWVSTSEAAKKIPMIQLLSPDYFLCHGVKFDHALWNLNTHNIIEMTDYDEQKATNCIEAALLNFNECAKQYQQEYIVDYYHFSRIVNLQLELYEFLKIFRMYRSFSIHNPCLRKSELLKILTSRMLLFPFVKFGRLPKKIFGRR